MTTPTDADTHAALAAATVDELTHEIAARLQMQPKLVARAIRTALIAHRAGTNTR